MPITVVATTTIAGANGGTSSAFDSTGANCLAVFLAYGGSPTVTDNKGNTFTADTAQASAPTGRWYYCLNATAGTGHTVTIGGGSTASSCVVYALAGVATSAAYSSPGSTTLAGGSTSAAFGVGITPPENNCIILQAVAMPAATFSSAAGANGWALGGWTSGNAGVNYGSISAYKIQATVSTVPGSETYATWTGAQGGTPQVVAIFKSAPPAASITIATPSAFEVHQRSGTTGSIQITGTVSGATEDIEASFNGGAYQTIATAVAAGSFSGTLTGQAQGQGTLIVRKKVTTATSASVANVGIGDVFLIGGDSISEGRGTNPQTYSHATLKAAAFRQDNAWIEGNDGIDTGTSVGSHWPLLATQIMADQGVPVAFVSCGTGSTDVAGTNNQWAKPNSGYSAFTTQTANSTVSSVRAVLMHLGPNAVVNGTTLSQATYNAAIDTLAANIAADIAGAPKLHLGVFGEVSTGSPPDRVAALNNLRRAILEAQGDNANVKAGPCLVDLDYTDGVHPQSDVQLQAVAHRWWFAIKESVYGGSNGRGPRIASAVWNVARNQLTVTFDRTLKTGLTHSTGCWSVSDNGSAMTVSSVAYHGTNPNALLINTSAAAAGAAGTTTVTLGNGDSAVGLVVPRSADLTLPAGGTVTIPAEPSYLVSVTEATSLATTVTLTLTTDGSTPAASKTGLRWAFFDQALPSGFLAPTAKGVGASTNGSGVLTLTITGTALTVGATGYLIVSNTDGTTGQSPAADVFSGPVVVS